MPGPRNFRSSTLPWLVILTLWLLCFWPMMAGQQIAGYRDSGYLYYPMFQWIDQEIASGNFPLWMPFDDSGFPLLADGTSSMLYPGKLIFHLRFLSFPARYGIYLAMHVLLAAAGTFWLARTLRASQWGACVAAISFAFGGSLLFQVCNVIYLVSGAWLPVALACVWKMLERGQSRPTSWAIVAGASCAMMILGGDPQMVYHVGLISLVTIAGSTWPRFWPVLRTGVGRSELGEHADVLSTCSPSSSARPCLKNLSALLVMVIVTSGLAAAQLLPTYQWAKQSDRMKTTEPLNVWQALGSEQPLSSLSALADAPHGPPLTDVYQFSQEPWTVLEFLWSGVLGKDAPVNTRWTAAFPGAERIWMPSIYFGMIPFVLALSGMRFWNSRTSKRRKGRAGQVWLSWIAVWFLLASFGWYGPVWLANELAIPIGDDLHQGSFGAYWLMVTLLPKYILFRYPAKLVIVSALAMCVLAGIQTRPTAILKCVRCWLGLVIISVIAAIVMLMPIAFEQLQRCHSTGLYGPFQAPQCQWEIVFSLSKTAILAGTVCLGCLICYPLKKTSGGLKQRRLCVYLRGAPAIVALLVAFDLGISNRWMLHPVPTAVITGPSLIAAKIQHDRAAANLDPETLLSIDRTDDRVDFSPEWFEAPSTNRIAEIIRWRRESLFPKTHLEIPNVQVQGSFCSIMPSALDRINDSINNNQLLKIARGADGFLEATDAGPSRGSAGSIDVVGGAFSHRAPRWLEAPATFRPSLQWNELPQPIAWLAKGTSDRADEPSLYCECVWNDGKFTIRLPETSAGKQPDSDHRLIFRMLAVPGWTANLIDDKLPSRTPIAINKLDALHWWMNVPPNHHQIELVYQPTEFRIGLALSMLSFLACLTYLFNEFRACQSPKDDGFGAELSK